MDVRLPSGVVVKNVPEGISKSDLRMRLLKAGVQVDAPAEAVDPTEGMGGLAKVGAGFGKAFVDIGRGTQQLFGLGDQAALQQRIDDEKALSEPLLNTKAGLAGNIAGNVAALAPAALIPGVNTVAGGAALGAASGALQPVATGEDRADNVVIGGAAGGAGTGLARLAGRILRPVGEAVTPRLRALGDQLREMGGRLTPGQATGSRFLQGLEASMESFPPTSGAIRGIKEQNQRAINAQVARAIGENTDELSDEALGRAHARITGELNRVATDAPTQVSPRLVQSVTELEAANRGVVSVAGHPLVQEALDVAASGAATGRQLSHLSTRLRTAAEQEMRGQNGNRQMGLALYNVREALDDELMAGLPDDAARQAFQTAREQYRNLMTLTANKNVINEATGDVSAANLAGALKGKQKRAYLFGGGRQSPETRGMFQAARAGKAFRDIVGNSGTATRQFLPSMLTLGATGGVAGAVGGNPVEGAASGALLPLVAALAARGYARPGLAQYLRNGVPLPPALANNRRLAEALAAASGTLPIGYVQAKE